MKYFGQYENEIYSAGLRGVVPKLPIDIATLEKKAIAAWPDTIVSYVQGGCGDERTQDLNVAAFGKWGLVPRMMVDGSKRDMSIELFGMKLATPLFMAPIGVIGICAQDGHGDLAVARAAARTGVPMVASTLTVDPFEAVTPEFGDTPGFFQLYTPDDRGVAESFVHRAEAAGFKGIVVTLDTWVAGWRPRDLTLSSFPQLRGYCLANYLSDPVFRSRLAKPPEEDPASAVRHWSRDLRHDAHLGGTAVAALADEAAPALEGDLPPRRRPAGDRRRSRWHLLLHPRRPSGQRRCRLPRHAARPSWRRPGKLRCCSIQASGPVPTSSRRSPSAPRPSGSAAPMPGAWPSMGPMESSTFCGACSPRPIC